jgi:hypothetical protein
MATVAFTLAQYNDTRVRSAIRAIQSVTEKPWASLA